MAMVILLSTVLVLFSSFNEIKPVSIQFQPFFGVKQLVLADTWYSLKNGDSFQVKTLRFYLTHFRLLHNGKQVWAENNSVHLLDVSKPNSLQFTLNILENLQFDQLIFDLGIDSATNVSGALGGPLDPTQGMYWSWQSGYINLKLEGITNRNKTHDKFEYHLGGYLFPNLSLQTIELSVDRKDSIDIAIDLSRFFKQIDIKSQPDVMAPGAEAVRLSKVAASIFSTQIK
jgi:hypothetical protein